MKGMQHVDNSWDGVLQDGEVLLWQDQPALSLVLEDIRWLEAGMGVFFMGFSIVWMGMTAQAGGIFWMFGLIFFFIGMRNSLGQFLIDPWLRRQTYFTLTNQRAFVASRKLMGGKVLKSYVIDKNSPLELEQGQTHSIYFATEERRRNKGGRYTAKIGFEHMSESAEPFQLLEKIRRGDV